jgi:hypothetical protein
MLLGRSADVQLELEGRLAASDSFWSRPGAHDAAGQIVGLVLLSTPTSGGPLTWTQQHRFWAQSSKSGRLAFLEVKAAFAIGSFMSDSLAPPSGAAELLPVAQYPTRLPMFPVTGSGMFPALPFITMFIPRRS